MIVLALNAHWSALYAVRGITVTYTAGSASIRCLRVVPEDIEVEKEQGDTIETYQLRTYICPASKLIYDGTTEIVEPAERARIKEKDIHGRTRNFEVSYGPASRHWDWLDEHHVLIRIYAVEIK